MRIRNGAALALLALGVGCTDPANGDDPLAALDSTTVTTRYMAPYWREQMDASSDTWQQALSTCQGADATQRPNCAFVLEANLAKGMKDLSPEYRSERNFLEIPRP
jgi:hypothetical protein